MDAFHVEDAYCRDCDSEEIFTDVKEEPAVYKIGARCSGCDRDYGVLDRINRSDVDHTDEVWEQAESVVQTYLERAN